MSELRQENVPAPLGRIAHSPLHIDTKAADKAPEGAESARRQYGRLACTEGAAPQSGVRLEWGEAESTVGAISQDRRRPRNSTCVVGGKAGSPEA